VEEAGWAGVSHAQVLWFIGKSSPTAIGQEVATAGGATPWWLTLIVGLLALVGVLLSAVILRRTGRETVKVNQDAVANAISTRIELRLGALELDKWRRREETMRLLRWAAEQATDDNDDRAVVGIRVLEALGGSELLQAEDQGLIDAVVDALLEEPESAYAEAQSSGDEVQVELLPDEDGGDEDGN
jgi:hypothetical protein